MPDKNQTEKTKSPALTQEQAETVVKKKRGAKWTQDLTADGGELLEPGDNARFIRYAMASWDLPPIDISDPKQVEQRLHDYFQHCADNDRKPQIIGMANWLGVDRSTINSWKRGEYRTDTHSPLIRKAIDLIEELWIEYMQNGKVNPATGIFLAKNFFQYADTQQVVVTPSNPLDGLDDEQARKRIADAIPIDDTDSEVE